MEKRQIDQLKDLMVNTFNYAMSIEEKALAKKMTQGLTISEIHTIAAVGLNEENSMTVVAGRLNVTLATLNVSIGKLENKGFVERRRCDTDRRQMLVKLTAKGRKAWRAHDAFHHKLVEEALSDLTPEEEQAVLRGLTSVVSFLEEEYNSL